MKKYLCLILCIFLFSCDGSQRSSNEELPTENITNEVSPELILANDELANIAEKTAPWKNEPIVEFSSDEEIKGFLVLIDQIKDDFKKTTISKKNKTETLNFEKDFFGEINGIANYKLEYVHDDGQEEGSITFDAIETYLFNGNFDFKGYQNLNFSLHGSLKYSRATYEEIGFLTIDTLDGGVSFKNELGVHTISIHLVEEIRSTTREDANTYKGLLNGKEIYGILPLQWYLAQFD